MADTVVVDTSTVSADVPQTAPKAPEAISIDAGRTTRPQKQPETAKSATIDPKKAPEANKTTDTPKEPYKKYVFDSNGKKIERVFNSDEEIRLAIQKSIGLEEKMSTHADKVKAAEELVGILQSDDPGAWKKFIKQCRSNGIDPDKFATEILYSKMEYDKLTPEQKKLREYEERDAEAKAEQEIKDAEAAKLKTEEEEKIKAGKAKEWAAKFEAECAKALESKKLPPTKLSLALLAQYMQAGFSQKQEYTLEQIIPYVQRDLQHLQKQSIGVLKGKELLDYLGPEIVEAVTKAKVEVHNKGGKVFPEKEPEKKPNKKVAGKTIKQQLLEKPLDSDFGDDFR